MTLSSIAFNAPIPPTAWSSHPALQFFAKYVKDIDQNFTTLEPERYFNADCKMYHPDDSLTTGVDAVWEYVGSFYKVYAKVARDLRTLIVVSDDEKGTHRIYVEVVTNLYPTDDAQPVEVPQCIIYTVGKADEGKGTDGLQVWELRAYYDSSLIRNAH